MYPFQGWGNGLKVSGWQPTPPKIVFEALRLAEVSPDDIVYDLGCGDGRVIVMAAKLFGARAVGFEIDPALVARARTRIARSGVGHLVHTRRQNMLSIHDLYRATVVFLFLPQPVVSRLRPVILRRCRSGVRVVSVSSWIKNWPPEKELLVRGRYLIWRVGLWCV
jgi:SAM-dependent methyltransferase